LNLKCDEPLSNVAFKFNLRRYIKERRLEEARRRAAAAGQLKAIGAPNAGLTRAIGGCQKGAGGGYQMVPYKPPEDSEDEDGEDEDEGDGDGGSAHAKLRAARAGKKVSKPMADAIEDMEVSEELRDMEEMSEEEVRSELKRARGRMHDVRVAHSADNAARQLKHSTRIQTSSDVYGKAGSATGEQHMAEALAGFQRACKAEDEAEERRVAKRAKLTHDIIETDGAGKDIVALLEQGEETVDSLLKKQCVQLLKHLTGDSDKGKIGVLKERLRNLPAVTNAVELGLAAVGARGAAAAAEAQAVWRAHLAAETAAAAAEGGSGEEQLPGGAPARGAGGRDGSGAPARGPGGRGRGEGGRGRGGRGGARGRGEPP
jgi:hypothetical protein